MVIGEGETGDRTRVRDEPNRRKSDRSRLIAITY